MPRVLPGADAAAEPRDAAAALPTRLREARPKVAQGLLGPAERSTFGCLEKLRREGRAGPDHPPHLLTSRGERDAGR